MMTRWSRENRVLQRWVDYQSREVTGWLLTLPPSRRARELRRIMDEWRRSGVALNPVDIARVDASLDHPAGVARDALNVAMSAAASALPEPPNARITAGQRLAGVGWVILALLLGIVALLVVGWLGVLLVPVAIIWAEGNLHALNRGLSVVAVLAALGWAVKVLRDEHRPCRVDPVAGLAAVCCGFMLWIPVGLPAGVFLAFVVLGIACVLNVYLATFATALALAWVRHAWTL